MPFVELVAAALRELWMKFDNDGALESFVAAVVVIVTAKRVRAAAIAANAPLMRSNRPDLSIEIIDDCIVSGSLWRRRAACDRATQAIHVIIYFVTWLLHLFFIIESIDGAADLYLRCRRVEISVHGFKEPDGHNVCRLRIVARLRTHTINRPSILMLYLKHTRSRTLRILEEGWCVWHGSVVQYYLLVALSDLDSEM